MGARGAARLAAERGDPTEHEQRDVLKGQPSRHATSECDSSCHRTEMKNNRFVSAPATQY